VSESTAPAPVIVEHAISLLGKDYFTQTEAAHYCGMSISQFRAIAPSEGIVPAKFGGKLLYRRVDLQRAIERAWQLYDKLQVHGSSTGASRMGSANGRRSAA